MDWISTPFGGADQSGFNVVGAQGTGLKLRALRQIQVGSIVGAIGAPALLITENRDRQITGGYRARCARYLRLIRWRSAGAPRRSSIIIQAAVAAAAEHHGYRSSATNGVAVFGTKCSFRFNGVYRRQQSAIAWTSLKRHVGMEDAFLASLTKTLFRQCACGRRARRCASCQPAKTWVRVDSANGVRGRRELTAQVVACFWTVRARCEASACG